MHCDYAVALTLTMISLFYDAILQTIKFIHISVVHNTNNHWLNYINVWM